MKAMGIKDKRFYGDEPNLSKLLVSVKRAPQTAQLDRRSSEWMRRWRPSEPGELRARPHTGHT